MKKQITTHRILWTSFFVDLLDVVMNIGVAILTHSVVMLSEALQGFADLLTSGFLLIGYSRSKKRADGEFQFGYGKEIYFWTLLSVLAMFFVTATLSIVFGYNRIIKPEPIINTPFMFAGLAVAFATNSYACLLSIKRLCKNMNSKNIWQSFKRSALIEVKTASVLDLIGTLSAFFGIIAFIILMLTGDYRYDGYGALIIGINIACMSVVLMIELRSFIAGKSVSSQTIKTIKQVALATRGVRGVSDIRTMHQGSEKFMLNIDITVNDSLTAHEIGVIIDTLKVNLMSAIKNIRYIQVELDN